MSDAIDKLSADVLARARKGEPERYLAALVGPASPRADLIALAAFAADLARIPLTVKDPMMGEIRLQWWRDQFVALAEGQTTGNPIADALGSAIRRHRLAVPMLIAMTEARAFDLYPDPLPDKAAFDGYLSKTEAIPFELALRIAGIERERAGAIAANAGRAFGLARAALNLPMMLTRGRLFLPNVRFENAGISGDDLLAGRPSNGTERLVAAMAAESEAARAAVWPQIALMSRSERAALLPLAVVPAMLRMAQKQAASGWRERFDVSPLSRITAITMAHLRGRPV